jgi:hypothetical protein
MIYGLLVVKRSPDHRLQSVFDYCLQLAIRRAAIFTMVKGGVAEKSRAILRHDRNSLIRRFFRGDLKS